MSVIGFLGVFESYNQVFSCYNTDPAFGLFLQPSMSYFFFQSKFYFNFDFVYLQSPILYTSSYFYALTDPFYIVAYLYTEFHYMGQLFPQVDKLYYKAHLSTLVREY